MTEEILSQYNAFTDLEPLVIEWGRKRGIIQAGNREKQTLKACSEMGELADAVAKGEPIHDHAVAYDEIRDRTGELRDGCFVKTGLGAQE